MTESLLNVTSYLLVEDRAIRLFCNVSLAGEFFQGGNGRGSGTEQESGHRLQMCTGHQLVSWRSAGIPAGWFIVGDTAPGRAESLQHQSDVSPL